MILRKKAITGLLIFVTIISCNQEAEDEIEFVAYEGPFKEIVNAEIFHSDSAVVKAKLNRYEIFQHLLFL